MKELLNSPIFDNLKDGKLPGMDVGVTFSGKALFDLGATLFLLAVAIILSFQIIKKLS